ncbi:ead/Ea22-like family protein [Citrobacter freundii]|nr:ead/Ea22-like family protein [Citrobacter freundii]
MTALNKQALREAAEKAISEEGETWWNEEQLASDYGLALHRADAKFIAAANPSAVLELLDDLGASEKRIAELEARTVTLPDVEKWRSVDAVRAQNAYKVLVCKVLAAAGIGVKGE